VGTTKIKKGNKYSDGSRNEPPSLNEPAAILSADLSLDLLHFIHGCCCIVSTVEKNMVAIATGLPKICGFHRKVEKKYESSQTRDICILPQQKLTPVLFLWGVRLDSN